MVLKTLVCCWLLLLSSMMGRLADRENGRLMLLLLLLMVVSGVKTVAAESTADNVVRLVVEKGRRWRLAVLGRSNMPDALRFCGELVEFNCGGTMVVQQAIIFVVVALCI